MDFGQDALWAQIVTLLSQLQAQVANMLLPSRLWQFAIVVGCILAAWILRRATDERMREWMRSREGWPKWQLRALLTVNRRLQLIWFVVLI